MSEPTKKELYRDGLTIRDHFAGRALQALIAAEKPALECDGTRLVMARRAYEMADAMLKERAK